jgi:hypothetical protein
MMTNAANLLPFLGLVLASMIGAFLGALFKRLGEDFAAQQSIQKLTATVENIKAAISDDVWDRQKQWEMRRDAVSDAWRTLRELETFLIELHSDFSLPISDNEAIRSSLLNKRHHAREQFYSCLTKYLHATNLTDLVVGDELPKLLSAYFQQIGIIANKIINGDSKYFTSERKKELVDKSNEIRQEARKELNIKNADDVVV